MSRMNESPPRCPGILPVIKAIRSRARQSVVVCPMAIFMRLFIAREALDPHHKIGGPVLNTPLPTEVRLKAALNAAWRYSLWYPRLWIPHLTAGNADVPTCRRADVPTCRRADVPTCRRAERAPRRGPPHSQCLKAPGAAPLPRHAPPRAEVGQAADAAGVLRG